MQFDTNIQKEKSPLIKYDFTGVVDGASLWVETSNERINVIKAFAKWAEREGCELAASSSAVTDSDPRGEGFRVFFNKPKLELRPVVRARLPYMENMAFNQTYLLNHTGIFTNDDIVAAALSCPEVPQTIGEAKAVTAMIFAGETPFQIAYCLEQHGQTVKETRDQREEAYQQRNSERIERMSKYRVTDDMRQSDNDDE